MYLTLSTPEYHICCFIDTEENFIDVDDEDDENMNFCNEDKDDEEENEEEEGEEYDDVNSVDAATLGDMSLFYFSGKYRENTPVIPTKLNLFILV